MTDINDQDIDTNDNNDNTEQNIRTITGDDNDNNNKSNDNNNDNNSNNNYINGSQKCHINTQCEPCIDNEINMYDYCSINQYKQAVICTDINTNIQTIQYQPCNNLNNAISSNHYSFILLLFLLFIILVFSFAGMSQRKQYINRIQNNRLDRIINS